MRVRSLCLYLSVFVCCVVPNFLPAQAPYGYRFLPTRETPASVVYDVSHQRFYASVPNENAVYVIAESNGSLIQKISVPAPGSMDFSPDDSRLYVGSPSVEGYSIVDTTTLKVVDSVEPTASQPSLTNTGLFNAAGDIPYALAALSDGTVAYVGVNPGGGGGYLFVNNPATNIAISLPSIYYTGNLYKSLDGSVVISTAYFRGTANLCLYDTAAGAYTTSTPISYPITDIAVSPDASRILVSGHFLLDRNLTLVADLFPTSATSGSDSVGSIFSPDGSRIYVIKVLDTLLANYVVAVYSTSSQQLLGYVPIPVPVSPSTGRLIAATNAGKLLIATGQGVAEVDANSPQTLSAGTTQNRLYSLSPAQGSPTSPALTNLSGSGFLQGSTVFFDQTRALNSTFKTANSIDAQPPAGGPGVVPVSVAFPDGWAVFAPDAYSYGPAVTLQDVTAGSSAGGTTVQLTGYGFAGSSSSPQVTVGGSPAAVTNLSFTTPQTLTFTTPSGALGTADIQVTTSFGSTTIRGGFTYVKQQLLASLTPLQMLVDDTRNQLYVVDAHTGNVLAVDETTFAVRTLSSIPASPATRIAMTPDRSTLLVTSFAGCTLDLIDLSTGKHVRTIVPTPGNSPGTLRPYNAVATARGTAIVGLIDTALYLQGDLFEVDLTTGNVLPLQVDYGLSGSIPSSVLMAASSDGTHVYLETDGALGVGGIPSPGPLDRWQSSADETVKELPVIDPAYHLATDDSGDRLLQDFAFRNSQLRILASTAPSSVLADNRNLVYGEKLHSSGSLAYFPTTKGVEIYDMHHGNMVVSLGIPSGSLLNLDNLAINHDGSHLFVAQQDGIGVYDLSSVPLSIGSISPASGSSSGGVTVILHGSGFVPGTAVTIDGIAAGTKYIDPTQLQVVTPATSVAKVAVTLSNPGGATYTLDGAFDASNAPIPSTPTLTSISPSYLKTGSGGTGFLLNGTGLLPSSVIYLDGVPAGAEFENTTQLNAALYRIPGPGRQAVTVVNAPNPTPSNPVYITTYDSGASVLSTSPSTTSAGSPAFALQVNGDFEPGDGVLWNGSALATTYFSNDTLIANVPAALVSTPGNAIITVATPGQGISTPLSFTITASSANIALNSTALSFGPVLLGTTDTQSLTIQSTGTLPLALTAFTLSDTTSYSQTNNCPAALPAGQSCTVQIVFKPGGVGALAATLTLVSNATTAATAVALSGSAGDFQITTNPGAATAIAGQTATTQVIASITGVPPSPSLQLACTSGLPAGVSCAFAPLPTALTQGAQVTMSIATLSANSSLLPLLTVFPKVFAGMFLLAALGLRRRRLPTVLTSVLLATILVAGLTSCGGGSSSSSSGGGGPPTMQTYAITVTASAGAISRKTTFNLTLN